MLEAEVDIALLQESNMHFIRSFLSANFNSNHLKVCFVQSPVSRAAIFYSSNISLDFLEHLSTPDFTVAQFRLAGLPYFLVSAYFDRDCVIQSDLTQLETVLESAPNGRLLFLMPMSMLDMNFGMIIFEIVVAVIWPPG